MRVAGRPFSVIALAVLATAGGIWVLTAVAGLRPVDEYTIGNVVLSPEIPRLAGAVWGVMLIASAVLILLVHRLGWALLMVSTGVGLVAAVWQWYLGNHEPVQMAILVVTAFYLNAREMRDLLLYPTDRATTVPLAPREDATR